MLARADVLRSLEHHVLEEMGEAGAAGLLVGRTDVVGNRDGERRGRVVLGEDDTEAVLELDVGELDGRVRGAQRNGENDRGREQRRGEPAVTRHATS